MELPQHIAKLYRHWDGHVLPLQHPSPMESIFVDHALFQRLEWFIRERLRIWEQKITGNPPPFTTDPILNTYRFCNIFREFDAQTIAFHALLNPLRHDFPLWLMNMFMCRMIARPETIHHVGLLFFDEDKNRAWHQRLITSPRPRYGNAYVFPISVIQKSKAPTRELFLANFLPTIIPRIADVITSWQKLSVCSGLEKILPIFGYHLRFLWTEVLIDVAYQFPQYLNLFAPFPIGPGSAPTMKRINPHATPSILAQNLANLPINLELTYRHQPLRLSAENWEGIGCEYRKYTNLQNGHGRKRLYRSTI